MATRRQASGTIAAENVSVRIMGKDYAFACAPEEKASLLECVALVDAKMNDIKAMGKLTATERIAVMAALTIANELKADHDAAMTAGAERRIADTKLSNSPLDSGDARPRFEALNQEIEGFLEGLAKQVDSPQPPLFD